MTTTISKLLTDNDFINFLKSDINFFVDIGASSHSNSSESEVLLEHNFKGIMFECDNQEKTGNKFQTQTNKMSKYPVDVLPNKVTPDNILNILSEHEVEDGFYLALDIDGYDFFVLEKILSKYKPSFIISEINEKIPPDIKFTVKYDPDYFWDGTHYYGYSISMLESILTKYGYKIKMLDYNNVVLVPGSQEESISDIYKNGYYDRPDRSSKFHYNNDFDYDVNKLNSREEKIDFIKSYFSNIENKMQIDGKIIEKRNFFIE